MKNGSNSNEKIYLRSPSLDLNDIYLKEQYQEDPKLTQKDKLDLNKKNNQRTVKPLELNVQNNEEPLDIIKIHHKEKYQPIKIKNIETFDKSINSNTKFSNQKEILMNINHHEILNIHLTSCNNNNSNADLGINSPTYNLNLKKVLPFKKSITNEIKEVHIDNLESGSLSKNEWIKSKVIVTEKDNNKIYRFIPEGAEDCLLIATKHKKEYRIYSDESLNNLVGVISKNFIGNSYNISSRIINKDKNEDNICKIAFKINFFGIQGPNKIFIRMRNKNYESKMPVYMQKYKCFVLRFKDRKIKPSKKNFIIENQENVGRGNLNKDLGDCSSEIDKDNIILQFGETKTENEYVIDYTYPFSHIQAFGIGIASIQKKVFFG